MEGLVIVGFLGGYILYKSFQRSATEPKPTDGNKEGPRLPPPKFLYSDPALWTSAPVDITYRPYEVFTGPNNDPRRAYLLYGGSRVVHSGYKPVTQTNQAWPVTNPGEPGQTPGYRVQAPTAIGERPTSKTALQ